MLQKKRLLRRLIWPFVIKISWNSHVHVEFVRETFREKSMIHHDAKNDKVFGANLSIITTASSSIYAKFVF
jgi:hypothetical protein